MENFNLFADKIKKAHAEMDIMEVCYEDQLGYVNKEIQTQTSFNGFASAINYEADLRIAYALMVDEIKRKLGGIRNTTDKIFLLEEYEAELSKLKLISYREGKNPERYGHKKFTAIINNHTEYLFESYLTESDVQEYLALNYHLLDRAIDLVKKLESGIATEKPSDLFVEAPIVKNTFYIRGMIAYNVGDIGNYMYGRALSEAQVPLEITLAGAQANNIKSWARNNSDYTDKYDFGPGTNDRQTTFLDSQGDQRAIIMGYWSLEKTMFKKGK